MGFSSSIFSNVYATRICNGRGWFYPLKKLSQPDQLFVKSIAQAASKRPPAKTKPPVEIEKPKE